MSLEEELIKMKVTQDQEFANLSNYLTADYMDLYIPTSMRTNGDFISVKNFVEKLLTHSTISSRFINNSKKERQ